jgi:hypothetical protein
MNQTIEAIFGDEVFRPVIPPVIKANRMAHD